MAFNSSIRVLVAAFMTVMATMTAARAEPAQIVAFGDSLMAGYQLNPGESFPERLQAALRERGHDVVIANAGVSGDTTTAGLARLDWSVPDGTELVILGLGANDMLRGVDPDIPRRNLTEMIERLQARDMDVILMGMLAAPNLGASYGERFNAIYPDLAGEFGVELYPFFLDGVTTIAGMTLDDRMHPSAAGVDRMVEGVVPLVETWLSAQE
ncbi:arylesterase [Aliihoeflea aestuarii]|jgi:acyl-CoA thioesterase I|uniref:arylesterase n=1 Tax=Aliihoeflea aestuarii TaxID=453840 RepID=UPI002091F132|nr:arylesterase [Aliihoeflea aestuarii]MCO6391334.1 arylesterase [Aliihoeflea aestuarii]